MIAPAIAGIEMSLSLPPTVQLAEQRHWFSAKLSESMVECNGHDGFARGISVSNGVDWLGKAIFALQEKTDYSQARWQGTMKNVGGTVCRFPVCCRREVETSSAVISFSSGGDGNGFATVTPLTFNGFPHWLSACDLLPGSS